MAPRAKKQPIDEEVDGETCAAVEETKRLTASAYDHGILSKAKTLNARTLKPNKVLLAADGKDINKKSNVRKGRYLLNINAQLAACTGGKLGTLAQLDTRNPVLYIDFPDGRLKFFGTIVFPHNKYMVLKIGTKDILCEDVLESMVVFSETWWIGKKEDNPNEDQLPMPASLRAAEEAVKNVTWAGHEEGVPEDDDDGQESEEEATQPSQTQRAAGRSTGRLRAAKRPRYNESGSEPESEAEDADSGGDSIEEGDADEIVKPSQKRRAVNLGLSSPSEDGPEVKAMVKPTAVAPQRKGEAAPAVKAGKAKQGTLAGFLQPAGKGGKVGQDAKAKTKPAARSQKQKQIISDEEGEEDDQDSDDVDVASDEDADALARPAKKGVAKMPAGTLKKGAPPEGRKTKKAQAVRSESDEVIVLGSEDDGVGTQATPRRAARASAQKAKANLQDISSEEDEDDAPESDGSDYNMSG